MYIYIYIHITNCRQYCFGLRPIYIYIYIYIYIALYIFPDDIQSQLVRDLRLQWVMRDFLFFVKR